MEFGTSCHPPEIPARIFGNILFALNRTIKIWAPVQRAGSSLSHRSPSLPSRAFSSTVLATMFSSSMMMLSGPGVQTEPLVPHGGFDLSWLLNTVHHLLPPPRRKTPRPSLCRPVSPLLTSLSSSFSSSCLRLSALKLLSLTQEEEEEPDSSVCSKVAFEQSPGPEGVSLCSTALCLTLDLSLTLLQCIRWLLIIWLGFSIWHHHTGQ